MLEFFHAVFETIILTGTGRVALQDTWMIVLLVTALIWGGGPEKIAISVWIVVHEISRYLRNYADGFNMTFEEEFASVNVLSLAGDSMSLVRFVLLALQANRRYTMWIAAFQVIAMLGHATRAYSGDVTIFVYLLMTYGAGWAQIFIMTGGQIAHVRRKKGVYPDWRWQVRRARPASAIA